MLQDIVHGNGKIEYLELLTGLAADIEEGSLCGLGKTAPNPVLTTLRYFHDEYEAHIIEKRCPALSCKDLIAYYILPDKCERSCDACVGVCTAEAIFSGKKRIKIVDQDSRPIENAHLKIERFEESRKEYVVFNDAFPQSPLSKSFFQPYYSDQKGYVFVGLPIGNYKITATAIGYEQRSQEFYLGDDFLKFPEISLRSHFSIATTIEYISFSVLTVYEVLIGDIQSYFSTSLLRSVLMIYELLMFAFVILYGIEKFGILSKFHSKFGRVFTELSDELFHTILGVWSISNVFVTILLILFQGWSQALLFVGITAITALLDIYLYLIYEKTSRK